MDGFRLHLRFDKGEKHGRTEIRFTGLAQEVRAEKEKEREAQTAHDSEAPDHETRNRKTKGDESASAQEQRGIDSQKDQGACPQGEIGGSVMVDERTQILKMAESRKVLDEIGHGMRLGIPRFKAGSARLIADPRYPDPNRKERDVSPEAVDDLMNSGILGELPEHRTNQKLGWRECGLPGKKYKLYACVQ